MILRCFGVAPPGGAPLLLWMLRAGLQRRASESRPELRCASNGQLHSSAKGLCHLRLCKAVHCTHGCQCCLINPLPDAEKHAHTRLMSNGRGFTGEDVVSWSRGVPRGGGRKHPSRDELEI